MIILANRTEELSVVEEERQAWLQRVLVALGADKEIIKENSLKARNHILSLGLDVILKQEEIDIFRYEYEEADGEFMEKDKYPVAQWFKPKYILKNDNGEKYYEIHIEEWALPFQMQKI